MSKWLDPDQLFELEVDSYVFDHIAPRLREILGYHERYVSRLHRWRDKRDQARRIADEAAAAAMRGQLLEAQLRNVLHSMPDTFLLAFHRFDWTWVDMVVSINPALSDRAIAAMRLADSYVEAVAEMEARLDEFERTREWIELQLAYYVEKESESVNGDGEPLSPIEEAEKALEAARNAYTAGSAMRSNSSTAAAIARAINKAAIRTKTAFREARKLQEEAIRMDALATRSRATASWLDVLAHLLQLSSSEPTLGTESGRHPLYNQGEAAEFGFLLWIRGRDSDGRPFYNEYRENHTFPAPFPAE